MQIEAARIVSGVTRSIRLNTLYNEIGWPILHDRRNLWKLCVNVQNQEQHGTWLPEWSFTKVCWKPQYNLRQQNDGLTLSRETSLFERSFVPSAIKQWNTLSPILKNIQSLGVFKRELLRSMYTTWNLPLILCMGIGYCPLFMLHYAIIVAI